MSSKTRIVKNHFEILFYNNMQESKKFSDNIKSTYPLALPKKVFQEDYEKISSTNDFSFCNSKISKIFTNSNKSLL